MAFTILQSSPRYPNGGKWEQTVRFDANTDTSGVIDVNDVGAIEVAHVSLKADDSAHDATTVVGTIDSNGVAVSGLNGAGIYNLRIRGL